MNQEQVTGQVKRCLRHCLEQRDGPGIRTLTTRLVHRHGHPFLEQLLSQPEWSSHRLWWGEQIGHPTPHLRPQPYGNMRGPTAKQHQDDKTDGKIYGRIPGAAKEPSDQLQPTPSPQQYPGPQAGPHPDGPPADQTEPFSQPQGNPNGPPPAQVGKQRLKMAKAAQTIPTQGEDGTIPTVPQGTSKEQSQEGSPPSRRHRSHHLRGWLPRSELPHQFPQQDAA